VREAELPALIKRMKERLAREATRKQAAELWSATYILMGVRYPDALIDSVLHGVMTMEESVTYQSIIRKGEVNEARKMLLLQGRSRFGKPTAEVTATLEALTDVSQLEELGVRLLRASSWQELLGLPGPS
jgi:hypothetical protein